RVILARTVSSGLCVTTGRSSNVTATRREAGGAGGATTCSVNSRAKITISRYLFSAGLPFVYDALDAHHGGEGSERDRSSVLEHAARRPARRQSHTPQDARRTFRNGTRRARPAHVRSHPSGTDRVDEDPARRERRREQAGHRIERGFARTVTAWSFLGQALEVSE